MADATLSVRFPGQYFDAESGMHYNRHRYYAPELGRYVSADPIGQWGLIAFGLDDPQLRSSAQEILSPAIEVDELGYAAEILAADVGIYAYVDSSPVSWADPFASEKMKVQRKKAEAAAGGHRSTKGGKGRTTPKHEAGDARRARDQGGEKGDARRPYRGPGKKVGPRIPGLPPFFLLFDPCVSDPGGPLCPNPPQPNQCSVPSPDFG